MKWKSGEQSGETLTIVVPRIETEMTGSTSARSLTNWSLAWDDAVTQVPPTRVLYLAIGLRLWEAKESEETVGKLKKRENSTSQLSFHSVEAEAASPNWSTATKATDPASSAIPRENESRPRWTKRSETEVFKRLLGSYTAAGPRLRFVLNHSHLPRFWRILNLGPTKTALHPSRSHALPRMSVKLPPSNQGNFPRYRRGQYQKTAVPWFYPPTREQTRQKNFSGFIKLEGFFYSFYFSRSLRLPSSNYHRLLGPAHFFFLGSEPIFPM